MGLEELKNLIAELLAANEEEGILDIEGTPVKTYFTDEEIWHVNPPSKRKHGIHTAHLMNSNPSRSINIFKTEKDLESVPCPSVSR